MAIFSSEKFRSIGLLLLRIFPSVFLMTIHGYSKISGGPQSWEGLGKTMSNFGINFAPTFWGFMSAAAEFILPIFVILGLMTRPASLIVAFNMLVATTWLFMRLEPWQKIEYPFVLMIIFLCLFFTGPGKYSLDELVWKRKQIKNEI